MTGYKGTVEDKDQIGREYEMNTQGMWDLIKIRLLNYGNRWGRISICQWHKWDFQQNQMKIPNNIEAHKRSKINKKNFSQHIIVEKVSI